MTRVRRLYPGACLISVIALGGVAPACSRHSELRGELSVYAGQGNRPEPPDSGIPTIVGPDVLLGDQFPVCEGRMFGNCVGGNDFICGFEEWLPVVANDCQTRTGCRANGWLSLDLNEHGCPSSIGMTIPQQEFVACLLDIFGRHACPCPARSATRFLGLGNDGCKAQPCGATEFPCPTGFACVQDKCERVNADAGTGDGAI